MPEYFVEALALEHLPEKLVRIEIVRHLTVLTFFAAKRVIMPSFVRIRQTRVCLAYLFESVLRIGSSIFIWVDLQRHFAIGLLNLVLSGGLLNAEHLVETSFGNDLGNYEFVLLTKRRGILVGLCALFHHLL